MKIRYSADPVRYAAMSSEQLRATFLVDSLPQQRPKWICLPPKDP